MRSIIAFLYFFLVIPGLIHAQSADSKVSKKDSILLSKFNAKGIYPLIKSSKFCAVLPVDNITDKADPAMKYKLLFDFAQGTIDSVKVKEMNRGLAEIGRIINLHIAAGVKPENLEIVIVARGKAIYSLFSNDAFKKKFKADNPNTTIIQELESAGASFVTCGQAMQLMDIDRSSLQDNVKVAIAAKVALSTYQLKGYVTYDISEE